MNRHAYAVIAGLLSLAVSHTASADYYKLYRPRVEQGEIAAEADLNYGFDENNNNEDNYFSQVYTLEYGATSWWKTELGVEIERNNAESMMLTNLKWENVFAPFAPGEYWLDAGLYVELEKSWDDDEPDNFEGKLLFEKDYGRFRHVANVGFNHEFGDNHGNDWEGELAFGSAYKIQPGLWFGAEYYADIGSLNDVQGFSEEGHQIGPVIYGSLGALHYDTGVLFGISSAAPDATIKLNLEYEF